MSDSPKPLVAQLNAEQLNELMTVGDALFLKRIALAQGLSDATTFGLARPGEFTMGKPKRPPEVSEDFVNLGNTIRVVVGPIRPHALLMEGREVIEESFDPKDPVFERIQAQASARFKKGNKKRNPMFGTDCLVYVLATKSFATISFMKTARREARPLIALSGQVVDIFAHLIEGKDNSWFVPRVRPLVEAVSPPQITDTEHNAALSAFNTGKGGGAEDEEDEASDESSDNVSRRPR